MSFKYYILLPIVWVCLCFPSDAFGQYIKKETVNSQVYAVIYAEGLAGSAQWVSGFKMMKNDATIRHQVSRGNGGNPIVNDRIPMRFIIAPTDVANVTWMQAEGAGDGNGNLNADFRSTAATGCRSYKIAGDPNRKWRVPTQRELQFPFGDVLLVRLLSLQGLFLLFPVALLALQSYHYYKIIPSDKAFSK